MHENKCSPNTDSFFADLIPFFLLKTIFNFIFDEKVISNTWENAMYTYWKTPTSAFGLRLGPMLLETRRRRPSASVWIPSVLRCSAPGVAVGDPWRGFTYKLVFLRGNVCQGVCFTQRAVFTQDFFPSSYGSRDNRKKLKTETFSTISRPKTGRDVHFVTHFEAINVITKTFSLNAHCYNVEKAIKNSWQLGYF